MKRRFTHELDISTAGKLDAWALAFDVPRVEIIRRALEEYEKIPEVWLARPPETQPSETTPQSGRRPSDGAERVRVRLYPEHIEALEELEKSLSLKTRTAAVRKALLLADKYVRKQEDLKSGEAEATLQDFEEQPLHTSALDARPKTETSLWTNTAALTEVSERLGRNPAWVRVRTEERISPRMLTTIPRKWLTAQRDGEFILAARILEVRVRSLDERRGKRRYDWFPTYIGPKYAIRFETFYLEPQDLIQGAPYTHVGTANNLRPENSAEWESLLATARSIHNCCLDGLKKKSKA